MADLRRERLHRDAVLLDELGCLPIRTEPAGEQAVILDLGGRLNKTTARITHRYLMGVAQAAELIANLVVAARTADPEFREALDQALADEQERIARG